MQLLFALIVAMLSQNPTGGSKAEVVARFLGPEVALVVHLDLDQAMNPDFRDLLQRLAKDEVLMSGAVTTFRGWSDRLRKSGAHELLVLFDPGDLPGMPLVVIPLTHDADSRGLMQALSGGAAKPPFVWPASERIDGAVVAGTAKALVRIRSAPSMARPDALAALSDGGKAPLQAVLLLSRAQRRAIEESMANLPMEVGGSPITIVSQGLLWASFVVTFEPRSTFRAVVQASNEAQAQALQKLLKEALAHISQTIRNDPAAAKVASALSELHFQTDGDRVRSETDLEKAAELVALPIRQAHAASVREQCINNLKQIGLAMHSYHSEHTSLPAAYTTSKGGKPLLSWRVQLLPYLGEKSLYDEFHRDEPWDSPHNTQLIARMPKVYACLGESKRLVHEGKTTYLTPRGVATIFPGTEAIKLQDITDGTSNTILVVDASDALAVPWTKPDDWEIGTEPKIERLVGHHAGGTSFGLADGSVRFVKQTIQPNLLRNLLTRNGGEIIAEF
jgi:hypothetical protein